MKTIAKLLLVILMPNFAIALLLKNMIKDSEEEDKIQTIEDIGLFYFLSCSIVVLPLIGLISLFLFDKLNQNQTYNTIVKSSAYFGIIISVIYLKKTKALQKE